MVPYKPSPILHEFHVDNTLVRGVMGPFGSGKSVGMCWEIYFRCATQHKGADGFRRSRWAVVRNTQQQLKDTTLKTWMDWFPEGITGHYKVSDQCYQLEYGDIKAEILFRALDKPEDIKRLLSLELTGGFINEARELPWSIVKGLIGRTGRYPREQDGGCAWKGVIMDTNPPDSDHWWYQIFEEHRSPGVAMEDMTAKDRKKIASKYKLWKQPPAMIYNDDGDLVTNPKAENRENVPADYWENMAVGATKEYIKVYVQGQYGLVSDGRPVYPDYEDSLHCHKFDPDPSLPVYVGWDSSLRGQSCILAQISAAGQLRIFDEIVSDDSGFQDFVYHAVKPRLAKYGNFEFVASTMDPAAAMRRNDHDAVRTMQFLNGEREGDTPNLPFTTQPCDTNSPQQRIDSVNHFLTRLLRGKPALLLHPNCTRLRKGFLGRYEFKRMQVVGDEQYKDVPVKNKFSHPHDALQYLCRSAILENSNDDADDYQEGYWDRKRNAVTGY